MAIKSSMPGYTCEHCGRRCFSLIEGRCLGCPAPTKPGDFRRLSIFFGCVWALALGLWLTACDEEPSDPSTSPECQDIRQRYITAKFHFEEGVRAGWPPAMVSLQRSMLDRFVSMNWQCFK